MSNLTCLFVWCCTLSIEPIKVSSGKDGKVGHKNRSSSAKSVLLPEAAKHGPWFLESRVDGAMEHTVRRRLGRPLGQGGASKTLSTRIKIGLSQQ